MIISHGSIYTKILQIALSFMKKKRINNKPVYDLLSSKNQIFLPTPAWLCPGPTVGRGISQLSQIPVAFNTPFFFINHY